MSDTDNLLQTIAARWNAGLADQLVSRIAARFAAAEGRADEELLRLADAMRQLLKQQLGRTSVPVEQVRLLTTSYNLEQGLAQRGTALSLAKNMRHLAERRTDALHQARAAFLLAEAWYLAGALPFSIDWSKRGFGEAKPLEARGQGGRPYRVLYAAEEIRLAQRLALQGGLFEQAGRLLDDALRRFAALNDVAGQAAAMAAQAQAHALQGRWTDAINAAQRSLQAAAPLACKTPVLEGLWAGSRATLMAGDVPTARTWAEQAVDISRQAGDLGAAAQAALSLAFVEARSGDIAAARAAADRAVMLAERWNVEVLRRWVLLGRSWLRLAAGQADLDEMRATAESLAKCGAGTLEAEARYALCHALQAAGQDPTPQREKALEMFEQLKMGWHLAKAKAGEPLLI